MKDHSDFTKGFCRSSKSYNTKHLSNDESEIMFGMYKDGDVGRTTGEMAMRWKWLDSEWVPQLQVFDDAWNTLFHECIDVLKVLAEKDNKNIDEPEFATILTELGFKDLTPYQEPLNNYD